MNLRTRTTLDAVSVISGFLAAFFLSFDIVSVGGAIGVRDQFGHPHPLLAVRFGWMSDWGIRLLLVSFAAQLPKVKHDLRHAFGLKNNRQESDKGNASSSPENGKPRDVSSHVPSQDKGQSNVQG